MSGHNRKIRYAVVGLGDLAQEAILPEFEHAKSSELVALVSGDPVKLEALSKKYKVARTYSYEGLEDCLMTGDIDAVYVVTPNHLHREFTVRAAKKGMHVLCEKPMAANEADCRAMINAAREHNVKLMIAYRLHFEPGTLDGIDIASSGKLGDLRIFSSVFAQQIRPGNIRVAVPESLGGGTVWDMGVYCINAARYLFRDEPFEVIAFSANGDHSRFEGVDEMTSAILRFPQERLAMFTSSFGASSTSAMMLVGTEGRLEMEPAFDYSQDLEQRVTIKGDTSKKTFSRVGQFAAEMDYFSECILNGTDPEPSGEEGLADVRIVDAIYRSALTRVPVGIEPVKRVHRPSKDQEIKRKPGPEDVKTVHAASPSLKSS